MGDRLRAGKLSRYVTSHPGQLSLAISLWVGAMSTSLDWEGNVDLASHWPCDTDNSGLSTYGLNGLWKGDEHLAYAPPEYGPLLPLSFTYDLHVLIYLALLCGLLCCCLQFTKLRFVIESAGGEVALCNSDSVIRDTDLVSDSACIVWCDVLPESNTGRQTCIQHIQQLLTRFLKHWL